MPHRGTARIVVVAVGLLAVASGCAAGGEDAAPNPAADEAPAAPEVVPEPGRTIEATPPAAADLDGYRLAAIIADDSATSAELLTSVRSVASDTGAELREFSADDAGEDPVGAALAEALESDPDVIVALGAGTVDVLSFESAQLLDHQFLVVGAQLPEPTDNVTAVVWGGATSRGSAASADGELDVASVTAERGEDALEAGLASIQAGTTGVVLHLD